MRLSAAQLSQVLKRPGYRTTKLHDLPLKAAAARTVGALKKRMNKTEAEYAQLLEFRRLAGEIREWAYEDTKLELGPGAWFKPDFRVVGLGDETSFHETKGFWREAARVRIRTAAGKFPRYHFIALRKIKKKDGGGWAVEDFG